MPVARDGIERWPADGAPPGRRGRPAGVLVLLYPDDEGFARVVLTERASRDGHHSGEVSFPGGKAEPGDADIAATALREANEEIALDAEAAGVRIVGLLDRFWIPVSDFEVSPVVAVATTGRRSRPRPPRSPHRGAADGAVPARCPIVIVERTIRDWPLRYGATTLTGCRSGAPPRGS